MSLTRRPTSFWICTARYNFQNLTANNGDGVQLPSDIGRPSLTETSDVRVVTGSAAILPFSGSSNAARYAGLCVRMKLPDFLRAARFRTDSLPSLTEAVRLAAPLSHERPTPWIGRLALRQSISRSPEVFNFANSYSAFLNSCTLSPLCLAVCRVHGRQKYSEIDCCQRSWKL
jgi:hypothetical protein